MYMVINNIGGIMKEFTVEIEREIAVTVIAENVEQAEELAMSKNYEGHEELLLNRVVGVTELESNEEE